MEKDIIHYVQNEFIKQNKSLHNSIVLFGNYLSYSINRA